MNCNGINFSDKWLKGFDTAEQFASHPKHQRFIETGMVSREALISFFELFISQQTTQSHGNIHPNVSAEISETESQSSDSGNNSGEEGSNSGSASNTDEPVRKSRRKSVS